MNIRNFITHRRKDAAAILFIIIATILVFKWVPQTYFQQDEWYFMGQYLLARTDPFIIFRVFTGMHFLPLEQLILFAQYHVFWTDPVGYGVVSVLSHVVVVVLFYCLLRILKIRETYSCIGALFLSLNPISSQVVTWSPASASGAVSVLLFLGGCIVWIKNFTEKSVFLSILAATLFFFAMLTKVDVIVGYLFLITVTGLFIHKKKIAYAPVAVSFLFWLLIYIGGWVLGAKDNSPNSGRTISDVIKFIETVPLWLSQIFMNHNSLNLVLKLITGPYAAFFSVIDNDKLLKTLSTILGSAWYIAFFTIALVKKLTIKKMLLFPIFVVLSMLPYFLTYTKGLESRHYYIPVLFTAMWIAFFFDWAERNGFQKIKKIFLISFTILLMFFVLANQPLWDFLPSHALKARLGRELEKYVTYSPGTVVYFLKNGTSSPFQSGIGQMLLVYQAREDNSFVPYFRSYYPYTPYFLYGEYEQGFKKLGTKGFGYYNDEKFLIKDYGKGLFDAGSVRAFEYDLKNITLRDITTEIVPDLKR